jgi:hypothetical protein
MITADQKQGQDADDERPFHWLHLALCLPIRPFQTPGRLLALLRAAIRYVTTGARDADARNIPLEAELHDDDVELSEAEAVDDTWDRL